MTGIADRVAAPAPPPATTPPPVARRSPGEAEPRDADPGAQAAHRPMRPRGAYGAAAPDPSGRSGGLIDVFA